MADQALQSSFASVSRETVLEWATGEPLPAVALI